MKQNAYIIDWHTRGNIENVHRHIFPTIAGFKWVDHNMHRY